MARFLAFAVAVSPVDGSCGPTATCSCENSYKDSTLGMHSHLLGKITKPSKEWVLIHEYPNKNNDSPRTVNLALTYGHSKTTSTTWSVGIGAELKKIGIKLDGSLSKYKSETWTEGVTEQIGTTVKAHESINLYQRVVHQKVTWASRHQGGNVMKECGGAYTFRSDVYQFSKNKPKADLSEVVTSGNVTQVVGEDGTSGSCVKTGNCALEAAACCSRFGHFTLNCANRTRCEPSPEDAQPLAAGSVNIAQPAKCFKDGACFEPEEKYVCFSKCCSKTCKQHQSCSFKPGAWHCVPKKEDDDIPENEVVV